MVEKKKTERESFVEVGGGVLFIKSWTSPGVADPTPLFLFHDSLGCVELWREFPRVLSAGLGRTVVAYDRSGFGRSSERTEPLSPDFIVEEAEVCFPALLRAFGTNRFDLFGHSVGGAMAVTCAGRIPGCRSVVTESTLAFFEHRAFEGITKAKEEFRDPKNFDRLARYHGSKAAWVLRSWTDTWLSPAFADWTLAPQLEKVSCPLLAIHGEADEYGSKAIPEMICRCAGGASEMRIVPGCGHLPHREKPGLVLELLREFYRKIPSETG